METFNLQPLARAITRLDEGWQRYLREQDDEQIRDGLIPQNPKTLFGIHICQSRSI